MLRLCGHSVRRQALEVCFVGFRGSGHAGAACGRFCPVGHFGDAIVSRQLISGCVIAVGVAREVFVVVVVSVVVVVVVVVVCFVLASCGLSDRRHAFADATVVCVLGDLPGVVLLLIGVVCRHVGRRFARLSLPAFWQVGVSVGLVVRPYWCRLGDRCLGACGARPSGTTGAILCPLCFRRTSTPGTYSVGDFSCRFCRGIVPACSESV